MHDRLDDSHVRAASTEVAVQRLNNLRFGRLWRLLQERRRCHDHPVDAVATLHGLRINEGRLHGMRLAGSAEPLYGDHFVLDDTDGPNVRREAVRALLAAAEWYAAENERLEAVSRLDVVHLAELGKTIRELREMLPALRPTPTTPNPGVPETAAGWLRVLK